jgi:pimeloyl-ACP methyl ester carboxylesterase
MRIILIAFLIFLLSGCREQNNKPEPEYGNNSAVGQYAEVNGIKMYYEIYGQGEPLLLIHGNGDGINVMKKQISYFSKYYKVIAVDSRGHGKTIDPGDSLTYELMASDMNGLLAKLSMDSAYIIGQSDGAIIGLIMGYQFPGRVIKLAAMSPNIRPDSAVFYPDDSNWMVKAWDEAQHAIKNGDSKGMIKLKQIRLMKNHPHITNQQLAQVKPGVLLMTGDRDLILLSHIQEIYSALPRVQLCVYPGSSHFALRENPLVCNETIHRFFKKTFSMPNSFEGLKDY